MAEQVGVILRRTPQWQVLVVVDANGLATFPALAKSFKVERELGRRPYAAANHSHLMWLKLTSGHRRQQLRQAYLTVLPRLAASAQATARSLKMLFPPAVLAKVVWQPLTKITQLAAPDGAILNDALGRLWPIFPEGYGSRQWRARPALPAAILKSKLSSRDDIIFFGGSFNPWHHGHQACVDLCHQRFPQAKIVIVPDHNPWKKFAPQVCYWALYRELGQKLKKTPYLIYPGFYGREKEHPTAQWLLACHCRKKSFLMGDDNLMSFLSWHHAPQLLRGLARLIIVPRTANARERQKQITLLAKYNPRLKIVVLPEHPYAQLSSTKMRR